MSGRLIIHEHLHKVYIEKDYFFASQKARLSSYRLHELDNYIKNFKGDQWEKLRSQKTVLIQEYNLLESKTGINEVASSMSYQEIISNWKKQQFDLTFLCRFFQAYLDLNYRMEELILEYMNQINKFYENIYGHYLEILTQLPEFTTFVATINKNDLYRPLNQLNLALDKVVTYKIVTSERSLGKELAKIDPSLKIFKYRDLTEQIERQYDKFYSTQIKIAEAINSIRIGLTQIEAEKSRKTQERLSKQVLWLTILTVIIGIVQVVIAAIPFFR